MPSNSSRFRFLSVRRLALACFFFGLVTPCWASDEIDFSREIRPILSENCAFCHGPDEQTREAGLRLDLADGAWSVIEKGASDESELIRRIISDDPDEVMPPPDSNRSLTASQIELLRRWVDQGAAWEQHWSFQPLQAPPVPSVPHRDHAPIRNPIDAFVRKELDKRGIKPAPEADRPTLIRRLSLDLTGLPPTPQQVEAFVGDSDPGAYRRLVDRLLASPGFGERMAWNWLDAARYADTNGYQGDRERTMWPWRDWVVDALNRNLPYDQFTVWQIAGDLLPQSTFEQKLATAFCRNHMINGEGGRIAEENRVEYVMDITETVGTIWLGMTLNCCRCHDHKYDPITNREYYQLFAFFNQTPVDGRGGNPQTPPVLAAPSRQQSERLAALGDRLAALDNDIRSLRDSIAPDQAAQEAQLEETPEYQVLQERREEVVGQRDKLQESLPQVMVMEELPQGRPTFMLTRGLYNQPTDEVRAALPACFPLPEELATSSGAPMNRLTLARWLVDSANPLTPRVTVNRFWQQLFGIGLVKTTEDFGTQGETPVHLGLLNWLAWRFRENGWDVKDLIRVIVNSHTYRQSSQVLDPEAYESDPENRLLARGSRFRMPSWMLRDQALFVSGLLSPHRGGPAVNTYQPPGVWEEASFGKKTYQRDEGEELYRRSLYVFWRRIIAPTMFFDSASRQTCTVKVSRTNTPLHALQTFNGVAYVEAARVLAESVLFGRGVAGVAAGEESQVLEQVMRRVLGRPPSTREERILLRGLHRSRNEFKDQPEQARLLLEVGESPRDESIDPVEHAAWATLCLAVLNLDETLNRE
jgi:hypothetical protein